MVEEALLACPVRAPTHLISSYSGRDCVKSLRSSYTGLCPQNGCPVRAPTHYRRAYIYVCIYIQVWNMRSSLLNLANPEL